MADVGREPPPTPWVLPDPSLMPPGIDLVGIGADLEPGTLLAAYRGGLFPMHVRQRGRRRLGWWSPDPRGVVPLDAVHVSRSLQRVRRRFTVTVNQAFDAVVDGCATTHAGPQWLIPSMREAYADLHRSGWAHSIEVWREGALVGGLYGIADGGFFAGESMFHRERDASKVALVATAELLAADGSATERLFDVQWLTAHLASLGAVEVSRPEYLNRLQRALSLPLPSAFRLGLNLANDEAHPLM